MQVNDMFPQIRGYSVLDVSRHYYITGVSCVSNRSHPLAEGQVLKSTGHQLPSCPVQALSTMVLGDGRSNGFTDHPTDGHGWADDLTRDWGNARSSAFLR